ncbi:hypothetical protein BC936DRAFT_140937 [Jimgerdemannia flammicorona]|uniref:Uncharacterized protein n=1 Tax=Jimgerdemannia flammicorona TaxID=994334 RepID=A0A433A367_9FUNG|nr:hypothetical protein BC936DRAFT_140937 [Jimgerdemannia flammicorona]
MKKQFEEKCEETNKLQEQLRYKESDVSIKEEELKDLKAEFDAMLKERSRLDGMRRDLEAELSAARANHVELEEQRLENEHLRETIDRLRYDLDEIRSGRVAGRMPGYGEVTGKSVVIKSLHSELAPHSEEQNDVFAEDVDPVAHLHAEALEEKLPEVDAEERVRELEGEKNHYKQQVDEALLGLEQAKKMRQALEAEKRSLEAQIAQLRMQVRPEKEYANAAIQVSNQLFEIGVQCGDGDITMFEEPSLDAFPSLAADIAEESTGTPRTSTLSATVDAGVQCQIDRGINTELEELLNNELAKQRAIIEDLLRNKDMSAERRGSVQGKAVVVDMPMMNDDKGIRQRKLRDKKKSRTSFQDMNDLTDAMGNNTSVARRRPVSMAGMPPMAMLARSNDKIVTNTITFALYTLVVYLFGIVTSTFLIETGQTASPWEMALQGAGGMNDGPKSKVVEVVFWIIERVLLLDGDATALMPS